MYVKFSLYYYVSMENSVTLNNDGIIEIHVVGDQNYDSVHIMGRDTKRLLEMLGTQGKPQLILDNVTKLGVTDIAARRAVTELAHTLSYQKVAMLGDGSIMMRVATNLLLRAIGKGDKIRYFEDRLKANAWLFSNT